MEKLLNLEETAKLLNVGKSTLRRWDYDGKLKPIKTTGGHRRYKLSDLNKYIGVEENKETNIKNTVATYARCSTHDQKEHGNLDRQSNRLVEYAVSKGFVIKNIIKDIGSGINDRRKGFLQLCKLVQERQIDKVIIEHKDRLTRFQYNLIEDFFKSYGVDIILLDTKEYKYDEELVNDMMMLLASFSGRLYSVKENRKKDKNKTL